VDARPRAASAASFNPLGRVECACALSAIAPKERPFCTAIDASEMSDEASAPMICALMRRCDLASATTWKKPSGSFIPSAWKSGATTPVPSQVLALDAVFLADWLRQLLT